MANGVKAGKPRREAAWARSGLGRFLHDNGLTLALLALFALSLVGHALTGWFHDAEERRDEGQPAVGFGAYLGSGDFIESVFENWESEFLQMGVFIVLAAHLYQRGSSESKDPDKYEATEEDPREAKSPSSPHPVLRGGWRLTLYAHSLSLALLGLFVFSFGLHAVGGAAKYSEEQRRHGRPAVSAVQYLGTSSFWFESFQNWQSEFLSVGALVFFSVFLRHQGSAGSKPVAAPHRETEEG